MKDVNARVVYTVVMFVGINSTVGLIGLLLLSYVQIEANAAIVGLVGSLVGSLATLLTTTRTARDQDEPIPVQSVPGEPLETKEVVE